MVPSPPDFRRLKPLIHTWPSGQPIIRIFSQPHRPNAFNPGGHGGVSGRFSFFEDVDGATVPIMYGSNSPDGAISETVFHDVPIRGPNRRVLESRLSSLSIATLEPARDLTLVELFGHGLRRLQVRAQDLTDTEPTAYIKTVPWAKALHHALSDIDGLIWMSRQFNSAKALALFGDRLSSGDLHAVEPPLPLRLGAGRELVDTAANDAGIVII